ncbi:MAG: tetratricopeptide repeat protein [Gemmatimonadetes bacterium]|nr:tetratricopeptide repeat protein [Gemmatimonadota bacterium]
MSNRATGERLLASYRKTEALLRGALEEKPDCPDLIAQLGKAIALQGRTEDALECYLASLEIDPAQPGLLIRTGDLYAGEGCFEEALRFYEHYQQLCPERARGYRKMGDSLLVQEYIWSAADAYSLALDREPNNPELRDRLDKTVELCLMDF